MYQFAQMFSDTDVSSMRRTIFTCTAVAAFFAITGANIELPTSYISSSSGQIIISGKSISASLLAFLTYSCFRLYFLTQLSKEKIDRYFKDAEKEVRERTKKIDEQLSSILEKTGSISKIGDNSSTKLQTEGEVAKLTETLSSLTDLSAEIQNGHKRLRSDHYEQIRKLCNLLQTDQPLGSNDPIRDLTERIDGFTLQVGRAQKSAEQTISLIIDEDNMTHLIRGLAERIDKLKTLSQNYQETIELLEFTSPDAITAARAEQKIFEIIIPHLTAAIGVILCVARLLSEH